MAPADKSRLLPVSVDKGLLEYGHAPSFYVLSVAVFAHWQNLRRLHSIKSWVVLIETK